MNWAVVRGSIAGTSPCASDSRASSNRASPGSTRNVWPKGRPFKGLRPPRHRPSQHTVTRPRPAPSTKFGGRITETSSGSPGPSVERSSRRAGFFGAASGWETEAGREGVAAVPGAEAVAGAGLPRPR